MFSSKLLLLALSAVAANAYTCNVGHYVNNDPLSAKHNGAFYSMQDCDKKDLKGDGSTFVDCRCRRCPANFVSDGKTEHCSECPAEYKPNPEQSTCVPCEWRKCPAGTYNTVRTYNTHAFCGSQQCRPCPENTYQAADTVGATSCQACPGGSPDGITCPSNAPAVVHKPHHLVGEKACQHMKCFIEMGRHGEITLRSHHHRKEYPKSQWDQVRRKHHCKIYHPQDLKPAYCACTCTDEDLE
eukprot:g2674.t1